MYKPASAPFEFMVRPYGDRHCTNKRLAQFLEMISSFCPVILCAVTLSAAFMGFKLTSFIGAALLVLYYAIIFYIAYPRYKKHPQQGFYKICVDVSDTLLRDVYFNKIEPAIQKMLAKPLEKWSKMEKPPEIKMDVEGFDVVFERLTYAVDVKELCWPSDQDGKVQFCHNKPVFLVKIVNKGTNANYPINDKNPELSIFFIAYREPCRYLSWNSGFLATTEIYKPVRQLHLKERLYCEELGVVMDGPNDQGLVDPKSKPLSKTLQICCDEATCNIEIPIAYKAKV